MSIFKPFYRGWFRKRPDTTGPSSRGSHSHVEQYVSLPTKIGYESSRLNSEQQAKFLAAIRSLASNETDEYVRYQMAEALVGCIYPRYKFSEFGRLFLDDEKFLTFYRRFMDPENWHSLDRKYTLKELLKLVIHLNGDAAECGCYKGVSAYLICESLFNTAFNVHLFDSFEGLPEPKVIDGDYWTRGSLATSEDNVHATLAEFDNYKVYKGWIPDRFGDVAGCVFRFVHVDVDLYQPTLDSLNFFYPRLVPGGILLLDDYGFKPCPGAKAAADEFFARER
jgi:O-methyltransferase